LNPISFNPKNYFSQENSLREDTKKKEKENIIFRAIVKSTVRES